MIVRGDARFVDQAGGCHWCVQGTAAAKRDGNVGIGNFAPVGGDKVLPRDARHRVDHARIDEILDFTSLSAKAERHAATELALTELKALEVAKALATDPQLLLLDEVLAGLETTGKRRFMGMLRDLHTRFGVGIVMIEHDIETITSLCPRVAVLNFGQLIADGTPEAVFRDPAVIKSYTGA